MSCIVVHMTCRISRFQDGGSLNNYITIFLAEGIWKVYIFRHLFICFQTSVYTLVSIVDLTVANICFTGSAFATSKSTIDTSNSSNAVLLFLKQRYFYASLTTFSDYVIWSILILNIIGKVNKIVITYTSIHQEHKYWFEKMDFKTFFWRFIEVKDYRQDRSPDYSSPAVMSTRWSCLYVTSSVVISVVMITAHK